MLNNDTALANTPTLENIQNEDMSISPKALGNKLRNARKEKNIEISQAAEDTKIRYKILESFETGNYENLPEPIYALSFIRSYAEYLNLDVDENVDEFKRALVFHQQGLKPVTGLQNLPKARIPVIYISMLALLLASLLYASWISYNRSYYNNNTQQIIKTYRPLSLQVYLQQNFKA